MERRPTSILLTFCLATLLVAVAAAVAVDDVDPIIRLPTGGEGLAVAATRPWKCCDRPICPNIYPPFCVCKDLVEQCDVACKRCEVTRSDPSLHICNDRYIGHNPGPTCWEFAAAGGN